MDLLLSVALIVAGHLAAAGLGWLIDRDRARRERQAAPRCRVRDGGNRHDLRPLLRRHQRPEGAERTT